jgi:hypothetical protein
MKIFFSANLGGKLSVWTWFRETISRSVKWLQTRVNEDILVAL